MSDRCDIATAEVPADARAVRHELTRLIDTGIALVVSRPQLTATEVHEVRKLCKRARALLALLRPALSDRDYERVSRHLADAARSLASSRDATVLADAYTTLRGRTTTHTHSNRRRRAGPVAESGTAARQLGAARRLIAGAAVSRRGWSSLGPGVRAVYRRGRRRVPGTRSTPASKDLHAWRKHVKRLWYVLEPFRPVSPEWIGSLVRDARRLSEILGKEHDLALLEARLRRSRGDPSRTTARMLREAARRRAKLAARATTLGARLYAERPKSFERALHRDWKAARRVVADAGRPTQPRLRDGSPPARRPRSTRRASR